MRIDDINQEYLDKLPLKEKANLKMRMVNNDRIQKMLYEYELKRISQDYER